MDEIIDLPVRNEVATRAAMEMADGPLKMAMQAIKAGMSIADMRSMLDLQKEWEANEARKAYALAMSGFKAEPMEIFKSKAVGYKTLTGDFVGYKHAELSDVTDTICPAMSKHQLSHRWDVMQAGSSITVSCRITHALGHSESISMTGAPDNSGKKNAIQQIASTITYLQRYTLLAITGMSTKGEDDDGQGGKDDQAAGRDADGAMGAAAKAQPQAEHRPQAEPAFYPQDKFLENLPKWTEVIASGRKTADNLISFLCTKHPLTDVQKATLRNVKTA